MDAPPELIQGVFDELRKELMYSEQRSWYDCDGQFRFISAIIQAIVLHMKSETGARLHKMSCPHFDTNKLKARHEWMNRRYLTLNEIADPLSGGDRGSIVQVCYDRFILLIIINPTPKYSTGVESRIRSLAQLYLAAKSNKQMDSQSQWPVYGIVSTMDKWVILRYDHRSPAERTPKNWARYAGNDPGFILNSLAVFIELVEHYDEFDAKLSTDNQHTQNVKEQVKLIVNTIYRIMQLQMASLVPLSSRPPPFASSSSSAPSSSPSS